MCLLVNKFSFDHFVSHIKQKRTEKLNFVVCQSISDQRYYRTWDIVQTNRKPKLLLNNHYCVQTYIYYSRAPILVKVKSLFYWMDFFKESLATLFTGQTDWKPQEKHLLGSRRRVKTPGHAFVNAHWLCSFCVPITWL